ncbi:hypothetical protein C8Q74DRAFT_1406799 [Fomes fomentarius]|nr:hypothetical protein C8Q74DRAFT_1406799 [Fomes fomentarius]
MSSADESAFIEAYSEINATGYVQLASSVVFIYDCLLTIGAEGSLFWRRKATGASILFLFNKYLVLFYTVYSIIFLVVSLPDQSCTAVVKSTKIISIMQYLPWAAFSALRTFGLTRSWIVSILVFLLSSVPIGVNLAMFRFNIQGIVDPTFGCNPTVDIPIDIEHKTCLIAADAIVILVTWLKLARQGSKRKTFAYVLLYDDRTCANGAHFHTKRQVLVRPELAPPRNVHPIGAFSSIRSPLQGTSYVTAFTEPLTAILVSRFLIHLQYAEQKAIDANPHSEPLDDTGTLVFTSVLGSLATSIEMGEWFASDADVPPVELELSELPEQAIFA